VSEAVIPHKGGCLCGALRYEVAADPVRVTVCHCTYCQAASGGPYAIVVLFPRTAFSPSGDTATYAHRSDESGALLTTHSCPTCKTRVFVDLERFEGVVGAFGGTLDAPERVSRESPMARHVFVRSAAPGTVLPAGIDLYYGAAMPSGGDDPVPVVLSQPKTVGPNRELPEEFHA
jgi:hypothetical protein